MTSRPDRRQFIKMALGGCGGLGSTLAGPAAAAEAGRMVMGFPPTEAGIPGIRRILKSLQRSYQPDLGADLVYLPGDAGGVALKALRAAPADGHTVMLTPSTVITLSSQLRKLPDIDPMVDLVPVTAMVELTLALCLGPAVPRQVETPAQYMTWVAENPSSATFGSAGIGTPAHFVGMAMSRQADVLLKPTAYKSHRSMVDDLQHGSLPAGFFVLGEIRHLAGQGKLRIIAVTSEQRWPADPELPTLVECGFKEATASETGGFFVARGTPQAQIDKLAAALEAALQDPLTRAEQQAAGLRPILLQTEAYGDALKTEHAHWRELIAKTRFNLHG